MPAASVAPRRATRAAASVTSRVTASTRPSASTAASRDTSRATARSPPARSRATTYVLSSSSSVDFCPPAHPNTLTSSSSVASSATSRATARPPAAPRPRKECQLAPRDARRLSSDLVVSPLPPLCHFPSFLLTCTSIPGRVDSIDRGEERFESNRGRRISQQNLKTAISHCLACLPTLDVYAFTSFLPEAAASSFLVA